MNKLILPIVAICLSLIPRPLPANTPPAPTETVPGRFTVVSGTVDHGGGPVPTFVRIDSATGETWMLTQMPLKVPGQSVVSYIHAWVPLHETDGQLYKAVLRQMQE